MVSSTQAGEGGSCQSPKSPGPLQALPAPSSQCLCLLILLHARAGYSRFEGLAGGTRLCSEVCCTEHDWAGLGGQIAEETRKVYEGISSVDYGTWETPEPTWRVTTEAEEAQSSGNEAWEPSRSGQQRRGAPGLQAT